MNIADVWPVHYAIEADRGRCTATHPVFRTEDEARNAASFLNGQRADLPRVRILRRVIGPWEPIDADDSADDEPDLLGLLEEDAS